MKISKEWKIVFLMFLFTVTLIGTGEILECTMFVNPYETWCD